MTERPASATPQAAAAAAEAAARGGYGKLVAFLAARSGDLAGAEDALADAFAAALAAWPRTGVPQSPEAWLLTAARRRMIDAARARTRHAGAAARLRPLLEGLEAAGDGAALPDRRLALMLACAHPALDPALHAPLMLQAVLGLDAKMIGDVFLVSPAAMSKRLSRAKAKIRGAGVPFAEPGAEALPERLAAVLDAVYAAYAQGWDDPQGADPARRELAGEALFLARLVAGLAPASAEAQGLLALILHTLARRAARRDAQGRYTPLDAQDPARWDGAMIAEAEAILRRAAGLGAIGRYQLEAALQSAQADRRRFGRDTRAETVALYDALLALTGSPVVAANRAMAVAELRGAAEGLALLEAAAEDPRLAAYQPAWAARAELLARLGRREEAARACRRAAGLAVDPAVRAFLLDRLAALEAGD